MTDQLTERQEQLLEAIRTAGDWINRPTIASATGKSRLSPHDVVLLDRLVTAGLIEQRMGESKSPRGTEHQYKAVSVRG